jgi:type IV pilus assembly protein PilB
MVAVKDERLQGITILLAQEGIIEQQDAFEYQQLAMEKKSTILQYLVEENIVPARVMATSISHNFGLPLLSLDCIDTESLPISLVNHKLIMRHRLVPLYTRGTQLFLATDDPSKQASLKEIQFHTGLQIYPIIVETDKLSDLIDNLLNKREDIGLENYYDDSQDISDFEISSEDEEKEEDATSLSREDAPIVKFVNRILVEAIKKGVSDIHFEPYEREFRIRYRLDGMLYHVSSPTLNLATRIAARLKIMSNLDISERRLPQDGRFKMKLSRTKSMDFRVNTCPTTSGEKIVIRILDPGTTKLGIESLGFSKKQEFLFLQAISRPQGMVLVTGPTGSGKTVTLYTGLNILNTIDVNISTAEDPVELKIPGINQVNINPKAGLNFSEILRAFLRQDPDIIMVGEIRDLETAEIAIKAAQTGHLVLSTVHTNSAAETLTRMLNMGVQSFNIASSVSLIIAQRLVRKLCDACKVIRDDTTPKSLAELGFTIEDSQTLQTYKAVGCKLCTHGYRGRVGLFEVMPMSKTLGALIMRGGNSLDILKLARSEGMLTIYQAGLEKIKQGITSFEEVNRVSID